MFRACKQHDAISISLPPDLENLRIIMDIAFLHGKLYALTSNEGLHVIEADSANLSELKSSACFHQCIADGPEQQELYYDDSDSVYAAYVVLRYLLESNGSLLMVKRWITDFPHNDRWSDHGASFRFEVCEADLATSPGQWAKVDSLGGQALFLSSECSKSVLASQCLGGIQEDCIYFMHRVYENAIMYGNLGPHFGMNPLGDSGVYNMRDGEIMSLLPEDVMAELWGKQQFLTWFSPADA